MSDSTEPQFQEADAAVDQAVAAFISEIKSMSGKREAVAPAYIDDPDIANSMGPATLKLSLALAEYRDSRGEER
jgi:hypothetical protein